MITADQAKSEQEFAATYALVAAATVSQAEALVILIERGHARANHSHPGLGNEKTLAMSISGWLRTAGLSDNVTANDVLAAAKEIAASR